MSLPRLETARRGYRFVRKKAKRLLSHLWLARLKLRNRITSAPVLGTANVIVSMTTVRHRIDAVAYAIESIAAGQTRPRRLILWLDERDQDATEPAALRRLRGRGLEVRRTRDWGPHTKYYPALPDAVAQDLPLVTADDDILYPRYWLARLLSSASDDPSTVTCYRARIVSIQGDRLAPYDTWPWCWDTVVSMARLATGVSGVYYPTGMLHALQAHGTDFVQRCPRADDIWLHWVALQSGTKVRQLSPKPRHFPYIPGTQDHALVQENVQDGGNDRLFAALYSRADVEAVRHARAEEAAGSKRGVSGDH